MGDQGTRGQRSPEGCDGEVGISVKVRGKEPGNQPEVHKHVKSNVRNDGTDPWDRRGCIDGQWLFCRRRHPSHARPWGLRPEPLIKKRKYWPKGVPGDQIDKYFEGKPLGFVKTRRQDMDGIPFNVHCTRDGRYVTKLMSMHGLNTEVPTHTTWRQKTGGGGLPSIIRRVSHTTTTASIGWMTSTTDGTIPLDLSRFGIQNGGPLDNSRSFAPWRKQIQSSAEPKRGRRRQPHNLSFDGHWQ